MKRLITLLTTTLLLLVLVPKTAGAADFYVKKVADNMGLYLWTGTTEWLGDWNNTKGNLSDIYVDENGDKWYKKTVDIPAGTKVQAIVHKDSGSTQSNNSSEYYVSSTNSVITLSWDGEGDHTNTIADGSGKTFIDSTTPVLRYKVKDSSAPFTIVTFDDAHTTAKVSLQAKTTYEYEILGPNSVWFGDQNDGEMTSTNCMNWSFYGNKKCFITTNNEGEYVFSVKWESSDKAVVSVTYPNLKVGKYYLVVPDENLGNTPRAIANKPWLPENHKAFEMVAGRERNKNTLNDDITSLTLKIDGDKGRQLRYDDKGQIRFYIYDETNNQFYQPDPDDYEKVKREDGDGYVDGYNVELMPRYRTSNERDAVGRSHDNIKSVATGRYYYINKEHATVTLGGVDYPTMSLTFLFSKYNGERSYILNKGEDPRTFSNGNCIYYVNEKGERIIGNAKLLVTFLKTRAYNPGKNTSAMYYNEHIKDNGVYLVGSLTGDSYMQGVESNYDKDKFKMVPNYWLNGVIDNTIEPAQADSIVYSCEIKKGAASWDNFFLSFTTGDMLSSNDKWNSLLRPRVQNQMDAQALEGGIFYYLSTAGNGSDQSQSLNPLLSEEQKGRYASYRIYFNATYSTYRVEFYDKFSIAGTAVNNKVGDDNAYLAKEYRHQMQETELNGVKHYVYTGHFVKGGTFAFLVNEETFLNNYSEEDGKELADIADAEGLTDDQIRWSVQAPTGESVDCDYPYYNKVQWNKDGDDTNGTLGEGHKAIKWTLPTGEYTLRFYYGDIYGPTDEMNHSPLYTIDKKIRTTNITIEYNGDKKNYKGWNGFSDDCALWLPSGIKAYYAYDVAEEADGKKVVKLRELKGGYIPAHCGVLLYNDKLIGEKDVERLNYSPLPMDYTKDFAFYKEEYNAKYPNISDDVNLLMDCSTTDKLVELEQLEGGYYNYYFTYRCNTNGASRDVPLNFWKVLPKSKPNKNSTYLHVNKQITPLAFDVNTNNYYLEDASTVANNAKGAYCLFFSIDDVDNSEVTDIRIIQHDAKNNASDNIWYNMQGMRVSKPTTAGIYISNGKKIVIK